MRGATGHHGLVVEDERSTAGSSRTPEEELALIQRMLSHQVGIDPQQLGPVLDLTAVAWVHSGWRNTIVEDWHAEGRLTDGQMLRVNAHSTWRVRQLVRRWRTELGLFDDLLAQQGPDLDPDDVIWLAARIWRWLINPGRRLPTGQTLADLAGDELGEYRQDAAEAVDSIAAMAVEHGVGYALWRAAAHGGLACRHWWGTPTWRVLVERFLRALDAPADPHWRVSDRARTELTSKFAAPNDRARFGRTLLHRPWNLRTETTTLLVSAGVGFFRPPLPPLPTTTRLGPAAEPPMAPRAAPADAAHRPVPPGPPPRPPGSRGRR